MPDEPYFQQEVFTFVLLSRIFLFFEQDFVYKLLFSQRSLRLCGELLLVFLFRAIKAASLTASIRLPGSASPLPAMS